MEQLVLEGVSKNYHGQWVLREVNHQFHQGDSVAFMGHNGCGKSTLLKIIAGLVAPTSGRIKHTKKLRFSYVPEKFPAVNLSARSFLMRMCEMDGGKSKDIANIIESWGRDFFIEDMLDLSMKTLSKGTLQKIGVIQAMIEKPDVLILDEPLSGQDEDSQNVFLQKANALRNEGVTILMACHEVYLAKTLAKKIYTIQDGRMLDYEPEMNLSYYIDVENQQERPLIREMYRFGSGYRIQVSEAKLQDTVLHLMQDGWQLRGVSKVIEKDG